MYNLTDILFKIIFFVDEPDRLLGIGESMLLCSLVFCICVMPIIFNFFVIPRIEKRVSVKLTFPFRFYDYYPFGRCFGKHIDIAIYIVMKLLGVKREPNANYALSRMNNVEYNIKTASKFEIILAVIDVIVITVFFMGLSIMIIKIPPSFLSDKPNGSFSSNPVSIAPMPILHGTYQVNENR